jgi:hypothetical protein
MCNTGTYEILKLNNMDEDGCYVQLYFSTKTCPIDPWDMSEVQGFTV